MSKDFDVVEYLLFTCYQKVICPPVGWGYLIVGNITSLVVVVLSGKKDQIKQRKQKHNQNQNKNKNNKTKTQQSQHKNKTKSTKTSECVGSLESGYAQWKISRCDAAYPDANHNTMGSATCEPIIFGYSSKSLQKASHGLTQCSGICCIL
ncbi:hypothetical protein METBIDRAFT_32434 [Metschnikowia bicuspidata var. bicuspidata NRRL YB-4993]|uniref:Uncharacterized protein n=1 Tax=Metschnikowia bicuspidata var. bicuspidata NRRL YB-4993 TaxID=869754 RepID=A0A1A0H975_9ASCO|nr:hypothetical protein METBIDRAFT_32434 [Metschnikowia bicuspidata var. bicuspidata NRRL YB-4993]OBA20428.1 hypothetical protein METBIDRAFT_32434 [Metschnikowia bicuspidata var. bicuspidata NRRL YB-4993]